MTYSLLVVSMFLLSVMAAVIAAISQEADWQLVAYPALIAITALALYVHWRERAVVCPHCGEHEATLAPNCGHKARPWWRCNACRGGFAVDQSVRAFKETMVVEMLALGIFLSNWLRCRECHLWFFQHAKSEKNQTHTQACRTCGTSKPSRLQIVR